MAELKKRTLREQDQSELRTHLSLRGFHAKQREHVKQEMPKVEKDGQG